ncbi:MAG: PQQ-binding-like beta-propeller repeat protein, partial [Planctomycetes bacterium]|nr:PQQ-binding-like beta-propeller repeat protein [Planctomycetota bacterium]
MDCTQVNRKIELSVLGCLPESEQAAVGEHLASCQACRVAHDDYRFLVAQIKGSARPDLLGAGFSLASEVRSAVKVEIFRASYRATAWRMIPVAGSVAACLLLAFAGWQIWVSSGSRLESMLAKDRRRQSAVEASAAPSVLQAWQHKSAPSAPGSMADAVAVRGDSMYLLQTRDRQNYVAAIDTRTGERRWLSDVRSCGYLLTDDSRVYCLAPDEAGKFDLVALDATDGRLLWKRQQERADKLQTPCRASLLPGDRICWTADRTIHMLRRADGNPIWTRSIPDGGMLSAAVAVGDDLYVAPALGPSCLHAANCDESWRLGLWHVPYAPPRPPFSVTGAGILASTCPALPHRLLVCLTL